MKRIFRSKAAWIVALCVLVALAVLMFAAQNSSRTLDSIEVGAICYHKFYPQQEPANGEDLGTYTILASEFESHLQYIKENNIRVITVEELLDYTAGKIELPSKCILLTVDDCDISFYKYAYPLLQKYNMKINAAVIGNRMDWAQEGTAYRKLYCNWDEIREMAESGFVEFGAHTYNLHDTADGRTGTMIKTGESVEEYRKVLTEDLTALNNKLEKYVGYKPRFFVYPYYAISMQSIPILRDDLDYKLLFGGNSDSVYGYCGESVHTENYNPFERGKAPEDIIIKRYTPRTGEDIVQFMRTIFEEK